MSNSQQRGRKVEPKKQASSLRIFYIVVGVVAVAGGALLITFLTGQQAASQTGDIPTAPLTEPIGSGESDVQPSAPVTTTQNVSVQTGRTPEGFYYKGNPQAPVTVVEYADFQCPACGSFVSSSVYQNLNANYIDTGKVLYIFHDFPLSYHEKAIPASEAAYCAGEQGQYWAMHDAIFQNQAQWSGMAVGDFQRYLSSLAGQLGLDVNAFNTCLSGGTYRQHVSGTYQSAVDAGIPATPTFVVDGRQVTASELMLTVDAALAQKGGS